MQIHKATCRKSRSKNQKYIGPTNKYTHDKILSPANRFKKTNDNRRQDRVDCFLSISFRVTATLSKVFFRNKTTINLILLKPTTNVKENSKDFVIYLNKKKKNGKVHSLGEQWNVVPESKKNPLPPRVMLLLNNSLYLHLCLR